MPTAEIMNGSTKLWIAYPPNRTVKAAPSAESTITSVAYGNEADPTEL